MPISPFVANLRRKVGTDLLFFAGINAVVLNDQDEILLVDSRETNQWMPIGGMIEVGEEPADAAVREVFEETGVKVRPIRLAGVFDGPEVTYDNGDRVHYLTHVFLCKPVSGTPHAHDEENRDARFFSLSELPPMRAHHRRSIEMALSDQEQAFFHLRNA